MDIKMFGEISNAFGPSGFEEEVIRTIAGYMPEFDIENDAMNNLYARMPGVENNKPVIMLDAHTDECGFMIQNILDNGLLAILTLGGFQIHNLPAHSVIIRTRSGKKVKGIIIAKPLHFMTEAERAHSNLSIETTYIDVGAVSRDEVIHSFGISIGDPVMPKHSRSLRRSRSVRMPSGFT